MPADYFISYASADAAWAEWAGWVLEEAGASVILQAWDFVPGSNFVLEMQRTAAAARRTIAILSPDYLKSRFAAPEWAAAFAQDPEGMARTLVPVRVRDCALDGMFRTIVHIDLVGLEEPAARKRLADGLAAAAGAPYIPKIRGAISDLDRLRFIKQAFEVVRGHFEKGLEALAAEPAIDVDLIAPVGDRFRGRGLRQRQAARPVQDLAQWPDGRRQRDCLLRGRLRHGQYAERGAHGRR